MAAETFVKQDKQTENNWDHSELDVASNGAKNWRAFIRFDLTQCRPVVPPGANVTSAVLRLRLFTTPNATRTNEIRRVTTPCPEGLATCWGESTLTWGNQPGTAVAVTDAIPVCNGGSCNNQYYAWNVTADVAAFVSGTPNYGWRIGDTVEDGPNAVAKFRPHENGKATEGPQLVVVYRR